MPECAHAAELTVLVIVEWPALGGSVSVFVFLRMEVVNVFEISGGVLVGAVLSKSAEASLKPIVARFPLLLHVGLGTWQVRCCISLAFLITKVLRD